MSQREKEEKQKIKENAYRVAYTLVSDGMGFVANSLLGAPKKGPCNLCIALLEVFLEALPKGTEHRPFAKTFCVDFANPILNQMLYE